MTKINFVTQIDEDLQKEFKAIAVGLNKEISVATEEAMKLWMEEKKVKK